MVQKGDDIPIVNLDKPVKVIIDCPSCGATGLYSGMAEGRGRAVKCWDCKGTGGKTIVIQSFKGRKTRDDIQTVIYRRKSGKQTRTYQQFLDGDEPPEEE